ncbi:MAG: hypothetical protein Q9219_004095 [cf. Caloplaca sp. 3 TL-2023]
MSRSGGDEPSPLLRQETSNLSDYTVDSTSTFVNTPATIPTPGSPVHHRTGYRRLVSFNDQDTVYHGPERSPEQGDRQQEHGLGIKNLNPLPSPSPTITASPTGRRRSGTSASANPLLSPPLLQSKREYKPLQTPITEGHGEWEDCSSGPDPYQPFVADAETEDLRKQTKGVTPQPQGQSDTWCKAKKQLHHGKGNWLAISILTLSVYSTIMSGLWLGVAIAKPRFGHGIALTGTLLPPTATLLTAAIAKSIELSFVTVFVAFLGQVLSRRALIKRSKGITISEMSMRQWVMQPGTMVTHWQTVRYAALTFLGMIAISGALIAMLYTTASESLVSPKLKMGPIKERTLYGKVATVFANEQYIQQNCQTPISVAKDPVESGKTCIAIEHSGQAYHNYIQYLSNWTDAIARGTGSEDLSKRPAPVAMLYDNTTIQGSWIFRHDMKEISEIYSTDNYSRTVINVTMAMPHVGIFGAMRDPVNKILQPQDLEGLGEYDVQASIPSPTTNIICASMQSEELTPIVFSEWPVGNGSTTNLTGWPNGFDIPFYPDYINSTSVDDLFGFGEKYGRRAPVFPKLPKPFNTVLNATGWYADSVYLLATSESGNYTLCSLRASLTTKCSTHYHASLIGGSMDARCEAPKDELAYGATHHDATDGVIMTDWATVAAEWGRSLSLNSGIFDGASSNARLLTQLIPTAPALDPSLPSMAEALAVLSGCTLLLSSMDSPFIHEWNYSTTVPTLKEPQYQSFKASLQTKEFASGGTQQWQGVFYVVLFLTFATNLFCFCYFLIRHGLVTDFIEPQNLFSLSLNSPPSRALDGACGSGPEGEQLRMNWHIKMDQEREHFYVENGSGPAIKNRPTRPLDFEMDTSPIVFNNDLGDIRKYILYDS